MKIPAIAFALLFLHQSPVLAQDANDAHSKAVEVLESRGNLIHKGPDGTVVCLKPDAGNKEVTQVDIEGVNQLRDVVEVRIIASEGIDPEVFKELNPLPSVRRVEN